MSQRVLQSSRVSFQNANRVISSVSPKPQKDPISYFEPQELETDLYLAAYEDDIANVIHMHMLGANINGTNTHLPPVFWAVFNDNKPLMNYLVDNMSFAALDKYYQEIDMTLLIYCVINNQVDLVRKLVDKRVHTDVKDIRNHDVFYHARLHNNPEICKILGISSSCECTIL